MKKHPFDPISLVCGAVFIAAGGLLLANRFDLVGQSRWLAPLVLIAAALALLASARMSSGGDSGSEPAP